MNSNQHHPASRLHTQPACAKAQLDSVLTQKHASHSFTSTSEKTPPHKRLLLIQNSDLCVFTPAHINDCCPPAGPRTADHLQPLPPRDVAMCASALTAAPLLPPLLLLPSLSAALTQCCPRCCPHSVAVLLVQCWPLAAALSVLLPPTCLYSLRPVGLAEQQPLTGPSKTCHVCSCSELAAALSLLLAGLSGSLPSWLPQLVPSLSSGGSHADAEALSLLLIGLPGTGATAAPHCCAYTSPFTAA